MDCWIGEGDEYLSDSTDYMLVLMEWLLPLLEDIGLSANQRDIMTMFRDHLSELEIEMQRQILQLREHILGRYQRSLQG